MFEAALGMVSPLCFLLRNEADLIQVATVTQQLCGLLNGIAVVGTVLLCLWLGIRSQRRVPLWKVCGGGDLEPDPGREKWKEDHRFNSRERRHHSDGLAATLGRQQFVERVDF